MSKIVVTKPPEHALDELGVKSWPIWTCEVSRFDLHYQEKETCYLLEGQVAVTAGDQEVSFGSGDLVVFPQGLDCVWDVKSPVKKHYKFG